MLNPARRNIILLFLLLIVTACAESSFDSEDDQREPRTLTGAENMTISGTIVVPNEAGLVGQSGLVVRVDGDRAISTTTDAAGQFTLQVPMGIAQAADFGIYAITDHAGIPYGRRVAVDGNTVRAKKSVETGIIALAPYGGIYGQIRGYDRAQGITLLSSPSLIAVPETSFRAEATVRGDYRLLLPPGKWKPILANVGDANRGLAIPAVRSQLLLHAERQVVVAGQTQSGYAQFTGGKGVTAKPKVAVTLFHSSDLTHVYSDENDANVAVAGQAIADDYTYTFRDETPGQKNLWLAFGDTTGPQTAPQRLGILLDPNVSEDINSAYRPLSDEDLRQTRVGGNRDLGGTVYCWGTGNFGRLGIGDPLPHARLPVAVVFAEDLAQLSFSSLTVGENHACALTPKGRAYCWGDNDSGQIGNATGQKIHPSPVAVDALPNGARFLSIRAAARHTCGIASDGNSYCWGWNGRRQLGRDEGANQATPRRVLGDLVFSQLESSGSFNCGLTADGTAWCWGANQFGQCGVDPALEEHAKMHRVPRGQRPATARFTTLSLGPNQACGLATDGNAYCWGGNGGDQLGVGALPDLGYRFEPVRVNRDLLADEAHYKAIAAGTNRGCALSSDGNMFCWGRGKMGTLPGTDKPRRVVIDADTPAPKFTQIAVGHFSHCGLSTANEWFCWGGQMNALPLDTSELPLFPTAVPTLPNDLIFKDILLSESWGCGLAVLRSRQ